MLDPISADVCPNDCDVLLHFYRLNDENGKYGLPQIDSGLVDPVFVWRRHRLETLHPTVLRHGSKIIFPVCAMIHVPGLI